MMNKKLPIDEINEIAHLLPIAVLQDIEKRMTDWLAGGGKDDDAYMYQQSRYAQNVVHRLEEMAK